MSKRLRFRNTAGVLLLLPVLLLPLLAVAQEYPAKPIRIVVGPGPDIVARMMGARFTESWGQQVIVETRPGGGGTIAAELVSKTPPDGYTLLLASAAYTINAVLQPGPVDLLRDFAAVAYCARAPFLLVTHPSLPVRSVKELIALAKSRPGQIVYASSGNGTPPHLAGEMFKVAAGINVLHVPYKSAAPALIDVVGGQVHLMFPITSIGLPQVQSGKLRGLGVTSLERTRLAPDVPTLAENGLAGFELFGWNGLLAPAATPRAVISKLSAESLAALARTDMQQRFLKAGYEPGSPTLTPEKFHEQLRAEIALFAKVVKASGARVD